MIRCRAFCVLVLLTALQATPAALAQTPRSRAMQAGSTTMRREVMDLQSPDVDESPAQASRSAIRTRGSGAAYQRRAWVREPLLPVQADPAAPDYEHGTDAGCDDCCEDLCGGCDPCDDCCDDFCCADRCWLWGGDAFFCVDAWKSRIDDDHNNNFGTRGGINLAMPLGCTAWSGQLGASYAGYDFHGRATGEANAAEQQVFLTAGVFRTANLASCCWTDAFNIGCVYDHMQTDNSGDTAANLRLGQVRSYVGYVWDECNEFGVFGGGDTQWDQLGTNDLGRPVRTRAMQQMNFFWRHLWCSGAETMLYFGTAEDPGEMTFGFRGEMPLNDCLWVVGAAHYILPSTSGGNEAFSRYAEESWNVFVGLSYRLGCPRACSIVRSPWTPLLPVADNGSFVLEAPAQRF